VLNKGFVCKLVKIENEAGLDKNIQGYAVAGIKKERTVERCGIIFSQVKIQASTAKYLRQPGTCL